MLRGMRFVVAALVLVPAPALIGCESRAKDETPNPDLKVPDIPPSGHGAKHEPAKDKDRKEKSR